MAIFIRIFLPALLLLLLAVLIWQVSSRVYIVYRPQVLYIGDSLCEGTHDGRGPSLAQLADIAKDCVGGRKSVDYPPLPQGKTVIFYALGSNDAGSVDVAVYGADLAEKLAASDAKWIVCVLPDGQKPANAAIRDSMKTLCPNLIDPRQHGYLFSAADGIHGSIEDHRRFGLWLRGYVDKLLQQQPWQR